MVKSERVSFESLGKSTEREVEDVLHEDKL